MSASQSIQSRRPSSKYFPQRTNDFNEKQKQIQDEINKAYSSYVDHKVQEIQHKVILLLGRTRVGKSTIKSVLMDPRHIPEDMALFSVTKEPTFTSYMINDNHTVLDIIDTPGLFERSSKSNIDSRRSNQVILNLIAKCLNREITQIHLICFVLSCHAIGSEDMEALNEVTRFLGETMSKNACLIITQCESKTNEQCDNLQQQLREYPGFNVSYFQKGIHFSGAINRDHWNCAVETLNKEFATICEYRKKLIALFSSDIQPVQITECTISELKQKVEENMVLKTEIEKQKQQMVLQHESSEIVQKSLEYTLDHWKSETKRYQEALEKETDDSQQEIKRLEEDLQRFQQDIYDLEKIREEERIQAETEIDKLNRTIKSCNEEKKKLEEKRAEERKEFQKQVADLIAENNRLTKKIVQLEKDIADLIAGNNRLTKKIVQLEKDIADLIAENKRLTKKIAELKQTIADLIADNKRLTDKIAELQQLLNTLVDDFWTADSEMKRLNKIIIKNRARWCGSLFYDK